MLAALGAGSRSTFGASTRTKGSMEFVDLSHPIEDGMAAYPGLPPARIFALLDHEASRDRYDGQAEFFLGGAELAGNTGTYLDAPFHRFREREDLAALPLESVVGLPGAILGQDGAERAVSLDGVDERSLDGRAVLVRTGWDGRWGSEEYWSDAPFLPQPIVERLVAAKVRLVGVDFGNVDDTGDPSRPAHTGLLEAGIPIVENLRGLQRLPREGFVFFAPPIGIVRGAAFPVRAFAQVP
jgi:arylformamidase